MVIWKTITHEYLAWKPRNPRKLPVVVALETHRGPCESNIESHVSNTFVMWDIADYRRKIYGNQLQLSQKPMIPLLTAHWKLDYQ